MEHDFDIIEEGVLQRKSKIFREIEKVHNVKILRPSVTLIELIRVCIHSAMVETAIDMGYSAQYYETFDFETFLKRNNIVQLFEEIQTLINL